VHIGLEARGVLCCTQEDCGDINCIGGGGKPTGVISACIVQYGVWCGGVGHMQSYV
jgi:fructose-1,6-bisphosphatase/sedoheptulose 1,7-bisphosphatase-like protein